ncbi:MAG: hypothetical protein JWR80_2690 [Bradyrhizobium sp.]|nr:hypothetical protein [Bradyrhizobium sp.]
MNIPAGFSQRAETLFAEKLGFGRRWKTAAAEMLGIGRATLYRYLQDDTGVAADVLAKLVALEAPRAPVRSDREMVVLIANGLVEIQARIDADGWLGAPYPATVRRVFDLGAARNLSEGPGTWPTDLYGLMQRAQEPLFRWLPDMSWDIGGDYIAVRLVENGEASTACRALALPGGDPENEIEENLGYEMLLGLCRDRTDGEELYRTWRRTVIENVVLTSWSSTILMDPLLATLERSDEIVEAFYDRIPESFAINGQLPICSVSRTVLRRDGRVFHTECRQPEAIRRAREGVHDTIRYRPGMLYLKRAFRTFWSLPGLAELELQRRLLSLGWDVVLWPSLDRVDLLATSPDGSRRLAIDVKDYISPARLASRFKGFKSFEADHECVLVIPDYLTEADPHFEARFEASRAANGRPAVVLRTLSDLIEDLDL